MPNLNEIDSFGEISADEDFLLEQCFQDHKAFQDVMNLRKWLVVGRKGAGKTAIFKMILRNDAFDILSFGHTFRNYPWHHHDAQMHNGVPEHECFSHSWAYLILLTISKILLTRDHSQPCSEFALNALPTIENFLTDTYGSLDPEVSQVFVPTSRIKLKSSAGIDLGLASARVSADSISIAELPTLIQDINENMLAKVVGSLNEEISYL